eukprot:CAMPEP_0197441746 /NCGR_PEP_ID=MMETSP1175-20131217/7941_1 /TAXON_ID=1003142 /ORGANISM="Triceratium dubium, Strain CCMP147" /LENGTH=124 /DNA_ID=CAMNT_0042972075 /DNA_START=660 /DNA_END=1034 /DNA_ORIENTATION=-
MPQLFPEGDDADSQNAPRRMRMTLGHPATGTAYLRSFLSISCERRNAFANDGTRRKSLSAVSGAKTTGGYCGGYIGHMRAKNAQEDSAMCPSVLETIAETETEGYGLPQDRVSNSDRVAERPLG